MLLTAVAAAQGRSEKKPAVAAKHAQLKQSAYNANGSGEELTERG